MQLFVQPMNITVVDQQLFDWTSLPAAVLLKDDYLARARRSGSHLADSLGKTPEEAVYIGPPGVCPVCHSNVLELGETSKKVRCAVCGVYGPLKTEGETYRLEVTEEERVLAHTLLSGKFHHGDKLKNICLKPDPRTAEIPKLLEKYKSYLTYSKPKRD
jgi:hypothetical protein